VLTDRNDLDEQLYNTFSISSDVLRQTPKQADNRKDLKGLLSEESGGNVFTTMQKYAREEGLSHMDALTERKNVIVMADEPHRTQYLLQAEDMKDDSGAATRYDYTKYRRHVLPNAPFICFTATPLELPDKNT